MDPPVVPSMLKLNTRRKFFPWASFSRYSFSADNIRLVLGLRVLKHIKVLAFKLNSFPFYFWCVDSFLEFLNDLGKKVDEDWDGVSSSLEEIRRTLISRNGCLINLTADGKNLTNSVKFVSKFLDLLPSTSPVKSASWNARLPLTNEAIIIPTQVIYIYPLLTVQLEYIFAFFSSWCSRNHFLRLQVNYVGKAANIYDTGYELNGSAYVISKHISNTWLWDRVRVSGGAYGGFCDFDTHSGTFLGRCVELLYLLNPSFSLIFNFYVQGSSPSYLIGTPTC